MFENPPFVFEIMGPVKTHRKFNIKKKKDFKNSKSKKLSSKLKQKNKIHDLFFQ